jgi:hypothetical protein
LLDDESNDNGDFLDELGFSQHADEMIVSSWLDSFAVRSWFDKLTTSGIRSN